MNTSEPQAQSSGQSHFTYSAGQDASPSNYEPPTLRSKPRQKRDNDDDSTLMDLDALLSEEEEMDEDDSDEYQETHNAVKMDEDDSDEYQEGHNTAKPKQRQRHRNISSGMITVGGKRRKPPIVIDETTPQATPQNHPGKKRKLRGHNSALPADVYDDILSEQYDDSTYEDNASMNNGYSFKKTKSSTLVLGSPSNKKNKHDPHIVMVSGDEMDQSPQHDISKKWKKKLTITPFIDKLGIQLQEDSLDLGQYSIIPKDFFAQDPPGKTPSNDQSTSTADEHTPSISEDPNSMNDNEVTHLSDEIPLEYTPPISEDPDSTNDNGATHQSNEHALPISKYTAIPLQPNAEQEPNIGLLKRLARYIFG